MTCTFIVPMERYWEPIHICSCREGLQVSQYAWHPAPEKVLTTSKRRCLHCFMHLQSINPSTVIVQTRAIDAWDRNIYIYIYYIYIYIDIYIYICTMLRWYVFLAAQSPALQLFAKQPTGTGGTRIIIFSFSLCHRQKDFLGRWDISSMNFKHLAGIDGNIWECIKPFGVPIGCVTPSTTLLIVAQVLLRFFVFHRFRRTSSASPLSSQSCSIPKILSDFPLV